MILLVYVIPPNYTAHGPVLDWAPSEDRGESSWYLQGTGPLQLVCEHREVRLRYLF